MRFTAGFVGLALVCLPLVAWSQAPATTVGPATVRLAPLSQLHVGRARSAPAQVVARNLTMLSAEVSGRISEVLADNAQQVEAGTVLLRIDPREMQIARDAAKARVDSTLAQVALTELRHERAQRLAAKDFVSADELKEAQTLIAAARADAEQARAALAKADLDLARTTIQAPFAGVVRSRQAQVGMAVLPGTLLIELAESSGAEVLAYIEPSALASFQTGLERYFEYAGERYPIDILRVSSIVDPGRRAVEVRLQFTALGVTVGAEGLLRWQEPSLVLPADFVVSRDGVLGVFTAVDDRARFVELPGAQEGRPVAVNLPPTTAIVTQGRLALVDGQALRYE